MSGDPLVFWVAGAPVTQGSKTAYERRGGGRPILVEDRADVLVPWRAAVRRRARAAAEEQGWEVVPLRRPVTVSLTFCLPRPRSTRVDTPCTVGSGDLDKLERAVMDAMTGVVFADDAQVVGVVKGKEWAGGAYRGPGWPAGPGVRVAVGR